MTSSGGSSTTPEIEFWFDFGSNYSYLSVMRIEDQARQLGVRIAWKPFLLGPIFRALGMENSPFVLQQEKGAYVQQDMTRLCRKYGLAAWVKPNVFPRLGVLPLRIVLLGADQPWVGAFCRKVMELNFAHDQDINHPEQMASCWLKLVCLAPTFFSGPNPSRSRRFCANKRMKPAREASSALRLFLSEPRCTGAMIVWTTRLSARRNGRPEATEGVAWKIIPSDPPSGSSDFPWADHHVGATYDSSYRAPGSRTDSYSVSPRRA
nr:DsbA family protein [Bradyrhizobium sp. CCBAU 53421]